MAESMPELESAPAPVPMPPAQEPDMEPIQMPEQEPAEIPVQIPMQIPVPEPVPVPMSAPIPARPGPTRSSLVFVSSALDTIAASKDGRKKPQLAELVRKASEAATASDDESKVDPEILFAPLEMAAASTTVSVVTTAIDCIGKLISYSYFSLPSVPAPSSDRPPLIDRAIDTICSAFQEDDTPPEIELQIVKSLLAAVLNDKIVVHGAGLLKAVRLVYNIFLLSQSHTNQQVAQGALTQIVGVVFERVQSRLDVKEARIAATIGSASSAAEPSPGPDGRPSGLDGQDVESESVHEDTDSASILTDSHQSHTTRDTPVEHEGAPITLQSFENRRSFDDSHIHDNVPTLVTPNPARDEAGDRPGGLSAEAEDDIYFKDAYLIFRAMCRLSIKQIAVEQAHDLRSDGLRSKLLSLHVVHNILINHMPVIMSPHSAIRDDKNESPTSFLQALKPYLCLCLSRNGASSVSRVFEISCEIFWLMFKHMRVFLKKEIEVFMKEIYLSILEKRPVPPFQEYYILRLMSRMSADPRLLVEIYLNYDCDRTALDNMYQKVVESLGRITASPVPTPSNQTGPPDFWMDDAPDRSRFVVMPALTTSALAGPEPENRRLGPYALREEAMTSLLRILRSLVAWAHGDVSDQASDRSELKVSVDGRTRTSIDTRSSVPSPGLSRMEVQTPDDDPGIVEHEKRRKNELALCLELFGTKSKKGIAELIKHGFIPSSSPDNIARFLFENSDQIDKTTLGNFLGEGDDDSIAIMHSFVDMLNFHHTRFVDALRRFLQAFRLPGEAQKIDRLMLKFAERYTAGNPKAFANADTAYVLAYSTIMLNTDQHSPNFQSARMTPAQFINNNRGINDDANLPDEYLLTIFDDISRNEIVLIGERETSTAQPSNTKGIAATIGDSLVGRYGQRERHYQAAEAITTRTEFVFKKLMRAERRNSARHVSRFIPARSSRHVGPMFELTWMAFLTAFATHAQVSTSSGPFAASVDGLRLGTRIACLFDLTNPRQAFVSSLVKFTNLYNLSEMKEMNVEALKAVLGIAIIEGDRLKESWRDVLTCVSQLDRFQLISTGFDEGQIPNVMKIVSPPIQTGPATRKSLQIPPRSRQRSQSGALSLPPGIAEESNSANMVLAVDRIFTNTANLSGEAIVHFVRALCQVSLREIESSRQMESPRTFSLQKVVEVSGYNMNRVRFEWTNIWQELGAHFTVVGHSPNISVVNFALDSLRQLSMRFMEIGELPGFKFQKDFLRPFDDIMRDVNVSKGSDITVVQDMVLLCLMQILQAQGDNIRSGWRTMFSVFTHAAQQPSEGLVGLAFQNVADIYHNRFEAVISQAAFRDLTTCLSAFVKNSRFQKKALQALDMLNSSVVKMLRAAECPLSVPSVKKNGMKTTAVPVTASSQPAEEQFWFPVLFAFHDILMTGDDLEVRTLALNHLFQTLTSYGNGFTPAFWDTLWRQLLYPIFMVIRSSTEMSQASNNEELSVWLSTTLVQALRSMVQLFTHFFDSLEGMLDRFLDLLALCICQDNDTLARIGSNCLQQLIAANVAKFSPAHWHKIIDAFIDLFTKTEATALFSAATLMSNGSYSNTAATIAAAHAATVAATSKTESGSERSVLPIDTAVAPASSDAAVPVDNSTTELENYQPDVNVPAVPAVTTARRQFFNQIITKCVLQLLMIETVHSLFTDEEVYRRTPSGELLRLMEMLKKSYHFARRFNQDRDLRARLFRDGFMKQPPNLLKQESGSANVYISILLRMYKDQDKLIADSTLSAVDPSADPVDPAILIAAKQAHAAIEQALVPLSLDIVRGFTLLDEETQQRNITIWRPVVIDVLAGFTSFSEPDFRNHMKTFAPLVVSLMGRYMMGPDLQQAVQLLVMRMFELQLNLDLSNLKSDILAPTPQSPHPTGLAAASSLSSVMGQTPTSSLHHQRTSSRPQ